MSIYNPSAKELYTVVQNPTDVERTFGFLGPRGMTLGPGEAVTVPGDLVATLGALVQSGGKYRKFGGMERAIKAGRLQINSLPAPILYDPEDEVAKSIAIVGGVLGTVDPTYNSGQSDSFSPVG